MMRESLHAPPWTAEDVQQLRELAVAGTPTIVIARKLRRSVRAVRMRAKAEGIRFAGRKRKRALGGNNDPATG